MEGLQGGEHAVCICHCADTEAFLSGSGAVSTSVYILREGNRLEMGEMYSADERPAMQTSSRRKSKGLPCVVR